MRCCKSYRWTAAAFLWICSLSLCNSLPSHKVSCNTTADCETAIWESSVCLESGFCSNPYHNRGCLANSHIKSKSVSTLGTFQRICSSSDPPEAEQLGRCIHLRGWNYTEIRLMSNNWESAYFSTWIVQILLSEILGVPTSVDTGTADKVVDFYDIEGRFDYGKSYDWEAMRNAEAIKDCRLVVQPENVSEYKPCAHVSLEVWAGQADTVKLLEDEDVVEKPSAMGVIGDGGFFVPRFTAERDPTVVTYFGLMGEKNRRKLAERFLRPTKWGDYCTEVSDNNCTIPDDVAQRPPADAERSKMFAEGEYTGYFRKTAENDCDTYPLNCTGHFVDYPCGWSSYAEQQLFHLDVALQSSGDEPYCRGYTYTQMVEIWAAANATKSDVVMKWWTPEALIFSYSGSDAEFQKINLPVPTQECLDNRINTMDRCQANLSLRHGSEKGKCDDATEPLQKVVVNSLFDVCNDPAVPTATHSPAYDAIKNFQISGLELGVIFDQWLKGEDPENKLNDPRHAVCDWVVENLDVVRSFIPRSYPRVMEHEDITSNEPLTYASLLIGSAIMIVLLVVIVFVYRRRHRRAIIVAQIEFLFLLLSGLTFVQIGAISLATPPSNFSCIFAVWFVNLGYTLELVPLIIKIAAINRLMEAAKQMKRTQVRRVHLFLAAAIVTFGMIIYLTAWTVMDPLQKEDMYELTSDVNGDGATIVRVYNYCQSDNQFWSVIALLWRSVLLLSATVLAFQSRHSPVNVNESRTLGIMIYSQFSFLVWNLIVFFMQDALKVSQVSRIMSLVFSADVALVCCIYFIPKLLMSDAAFFLACRAQRSASVTYVVDTLSTRCPAPVTTEEATSSINSQPKTNTLQTLAAQPEAEPSLETGSPALATTETSSINSQPKINTLQTPSAEPEAENSLKTGSPALATTEEVIGLFSSQALASTEQTPAAQLEAYST